MVEPPAAVRRLYENFSKAFGALCLTERYDNLLMWAHYAQDHKGVVVGLDLNKAPGLSDLISPVNYSDSFPTTSDPAEQAAIFLGRPNRKWPDTYSLFLETLFTKGNDWAHEQEWRVIRPTGVDLSSDVDDRDISKQLVSIPPEAFVSIRIGCRATPDVSSNFARMAQSINPSVQVLKTRPSCQQFALEFLSIDEEWQVNPYDDNYEFIRRDDAYVLLDSKQVF